VGVGSGSSFGLALAGVGLGGRVACGDGAGVMVRAGLPYHVSSLTQAAGLAALRHYGEAMEILDAVRHQRDRLYETLSAMPGLEVFPSDANFVLFRTPLPPALVWEALLDHGVLIRDLSMVVPGSLRVTAGTPEEVDRFLAAFEEVLRTVEPEPAGDPNAAESW